MTCYNAKTEENFKSLSSLLKHITWVLLIVRLIEYIWKILNVSQSKESKLYTVIIVLHCGTALLFVSFVIQETYKKKEVKFVLLSKKKILSIFHEFTVKYRKLITFTSSSI